MKLLFIYNPKAGKAKIKNHLYDIIEIFSDAGYKVTVCPTRGRGDATEIVKSRREKCYDMVVCSGGDGTLDEVVTGMMQCEEKLPIGYIPAGSTNDFAKNLEIPNAMVKAAKEIVDGEKFLCDIGKFNEDAFVYIAAFGLFTEVSYATGQQKKNDLGHMAYLLEGVKSLSSVKSYQMKVETEEKCIQGDFIYGMITNSVSVAGFKNITGENVKLDDGKFEVTLVRRPQNLAELNNIMFSLVTKKMDSPCIETWKASQVKLQSKEVVSWTLDGEFGGEHKEVLIQNEQKAISFIIKKQN